MIRSDKISVLGVALTATDYVGAGQEIVNMARSSQPSMVAAANTHLIATARSKPEFRKILNKYALVLPDGMPLVWVMNRKGAKLKNRVYGPYLMQHVLRATPRPWRHYFFGGKPETLQKLIQNSRKLQPDLEVCGAKSPPFHQWTENDEAEFAKEINDAKPDFIWIALGGEKQETWISQNLHRYQRGVFLAVGDAFSLLAGERAFAPAWMQKSGLTWAYRLMQEPRRLFWRYGKFNTMFLFYLLWDILRGNPDLTRE